MTPEQVALVQTSFQKVAPIADTAADLFYGKLFEIAPQVRPMFPDDMSEQKTKLMKMLATAVTHLHEVEKVVPAVQHLGRTHVGYGVTDDQYDIVGEALIWTLGKGLGDGFTYDVKAAWIAAYTLLATVMKEAAAEVTVKA